MLSRIESEEQVSTAPCVATYDSLDWDLEDEPPETVEGELHPPVIHDALDVEQLKAEERDMDLWLEAKDPSSDFEHIDGILYSVAQPYKYAREYPRLVLPLSMREQVIKWAHDEVEHMAYLKTLR